MPQGCMLDASHENDANVLLEQRVGRRTRSLFLDRDDAPCVARAKSSLALLPSQDYYTWTNPTKRF